MRLAIWKRRCAATMWVAFCCALVGAAADSYDSLISRAAQALTAKQYSSATSLAEKAIALNPVRLDAYLYAAKGYDARRLFDDEIGMLQRALSHAPAEKKQLIRDAIAQARKTMAAGGGRTSAPSATRAVSTVTQAEIVVWKSMENSQIPQDFQTYLETYPNGAFAPQARQRLASIDTAARKLRESMPNMNGMWNCKGSLERVMDTTEDGKTDHKRTAEQVSDQLAFYRDGLTIKGFHRADVILDGVERVLDEGMVWGARHVTGKIDGETIVIVERGGSFGVGIHDESTTRFNFSSDRQTLYVEENEMDHVIWGGIFWERNSNHTSRVCTK